MRQIKTAALPQNILCGNQTHHEKNMSWNQGPSLWGDEGDMPPNFWTVGDMISFVPPQHFVIKSNVLVQI